MPREKASLDTRERLLDKAEELFASRGISGTSLRALTRGAGVNLAAVNYHFGSKEGLLDAVVARRAGEANAARLSELERVLVGKSPRVEEILSAFVLPGLEQRRLSRSPDSLARLFSRIQALPPQVVESLTRRHFGDVMARFLEALGAALPDVPAAEVANRFRFALGALVHVFSANFPLDTIPGHDGPGDDLEEISMQMIRFLACGMRAPGTPQERAHERGSGEGGQQQDAAGNRHANERDPRRAA